MKRNWTALALALGLTLTLTACGGNPGAAETPGSGAPTALRRLRQRVIWIMSRATES